MAGKRLSKEDFLLSLDLAPRMVVELVIKDSEGRIFLIERESEPFVGYWHLPGGFLMKGEKIQECVERLLGDECGMIVGGVRSEFLGVFENLEGDNRGHILHYVVKVDVDGVRGGKFFELLPGKMVHHQRDFLGGLGIK